MRSLDKLRDCIKTLDALSPRTLQRQGVSTA
jgi:hypothetical protein